MSIKYRSPSGRLEMVKVHTGSYPIRCIFYLYVCVIFMIINVDYQLPLMDYTNISFSK